jgi:hypothetical protein
MGLMGTGLWRYPTTVSCSDNFDFYNILTFRRIRFLARTVYFVVSMPPSMDEVLQVVDVIVDRCLNLDDSIFTLHETVECTVRVVSQQFVCRRLE